MHDCCKDNHGDQCGALAATSSGRHYREPLAPGQPKLVAGKPCKRGS